MRRLLIFFILSSSIIATSTLYAKKFWEEKPFTEWTLEEAQELLLAYKQVYYTRRARDLGHYTLTRSSPWVYADTTQVDVKKSGTDFSYTITWYSKPVCQAVIRVQQLQKNLSDDAALIMAKACENDSTITISIDFQNEAHRDEAGNRFYKLSLTGFENGCWLEKKNGEKILPTEHQLPEQVQIVERARVVLVFPKIIDGNPALTKNDKDVHVCFNVAGKEVREKFDLGDFEVKGKLEL